MSPIAHSYALAYAELLSFKITETLADFTQLSLTDFPIKNISELTKKSSLSISRLSVLSASGGVSFLFA